MEIFDRFIATILDYDIHGNGIVKQDGAVVFLDGGEIGDRVEVEILKKKKRFFYGKILNYEEKSGDRVENPCPYTRCSGCAFLSLSRKAELAWKKDRVKNALSRIGDLDVSVRDVLTRGEIFGYRNHMQFHIEGRKLCLYGKDRELISIRRCLMQTDRANEVLFALQGKKWLDALKLIGLRTTREGEILMILSGKDDLSERLLHDAVAFAVEYGIDSLYYTKNKNPRFHYGKTFTHLYGKKAITETLGGYRYEIAAGNFFQVNPEGAEAIIESVKGMMPKVDTAVELYAGIGTITLSASEKATHMIGNEISESSVDYARTTAKKNGVENVRYIAGAAETMLAKIGEEEKIDALIVDPPRAGLQKDVIDAIAEILPQTLLYISCNPSTLARDLEHLKESYRIECVQPIDMFPHASHVESVVLMSRN